jgi:hypothetical protein
MPKIEGLPGVLKALQKAARKYGEEHPSVIVGYTANYALAVHENVEMKWRGLPRGAGFGLVHSTKKRESTLVSKTAKQRGNYWDPPGRGQAKFLEQPARELKREFQRLIRTACENGATLKKALLIAGLRLQRESQQLCPVDFGNLKASAFTREE